MIYKFRVFSDINEKFLRCIEIDEEDTFMSLHEAIQVSVNFIKKEMASFYLSNDLWDRLTQITLMDVKDGEADDIFTMENTHLNEFLTEEGENLVYVYDFISDRVFYLVLSEIKNRNASLKYPLCSQSIGDPPVQTMSEKRVLKSVVSGKIITNVKKVSPLVTTKTVSKPEKSAKEVKKTKNVDVAKPVKVLKNDAKKTAIVDQPIEKNTVKIKESESKKTAKVTKTKKGKSFDEEDLDIDDLNIDDLDLENENPKKSPKGKKVAVKTSKNRTIDDEDYDDDEMDIGDDDDDSDDDLVDDIDDDIDEEEDFSFDEEEFDSKFKTETSMYGDFEEEDDFYDDSMFDNIDDYTDRI